MFVCAELSPVVEGEPQHCLIWADEPQVLPPLSLQEGTLLSIAMLTVLAAAWGFSALGNLLSNND